MFTVTGNVRGKQYSVTYDDGRLTGDHIALDIVRITALTTRGPVGPVGQYTEFDYLAAPLPALFLIMGVFTKVDNVTGDVPEADEVPEDAIA